MAAISCGLIFSTASAPHNLRGDKPKSIMKCVGAASRGRYETIAALPWLPLAKIRMRMGGCIYSTVVVIDVPRNALPVLGVMGRFAVSIKRIYSCTIKFSLRSDKAVNTLGLESFLL